MSGLLHMIREGAVIAGQAIAANKVRTTLTIIAVAIGVSVVVLIAAVFTGLRESVARSFEAANPNLFYLAPFDPTEIRLSDILNEDSPFWDRPPITDNEIFRVGTLPTVAETVVSVEDFELSIVHDGRRVNEIPGGAYSEGWIYSTAGDFIIGRNFTRMEVAQAREVVVISRHLAEELFGQRNPIGRRVRAQPEESLAPGRMLTVIGVFEFEPNIFTQAFRHFAFLPWSVATRKLGVNRRGLGTSVIPRDEVSLEEAQDQVTGALRSLRGLRPGEKNDFALLLPQQILNIINSFTSVFFFAMFVLSSGALVAGGIGVIGIMMISVTERTREIGIRKAVGARPREILWQFLVEASVLTLLGGAAGLVVGGGGALFLAEVTPVPASVPVWAVVLALLTAALTGILFGLLPALKASRLDPVAALGFEQ